MLNIEKTFGCVEKFDLIGNRMVGSPDGQESYSSYFTNFNQYKSLAAYAGSSLFWDTAGECQSEASTLLRATM